MVLKRATLFIALIAVIFSGCTKKYVSPYVPPYHIDGITDISVNANAPQAFMGLSVTYENSKQERVTLSVEGLPQGMYYQIFNPSGYPSFSSQITFTDSTAAIGTYTAKLVATGEISGRMTYPFTVNVTPVPECASSWTGVFNAANGCATGTNFTETVTLVPGVTNRISLNNFEKSGIALVADLNCGFQTITIPTQTIGAYSISGDGEFFTSGSSQFLRLRYFKSPLSGGSGFSCQEALNR